MKIKFTKMQGIGNDFIVIDQITPDAASVSMNPQLAVRLCDRRYGIGADQILHLKVPLDFRDRADVRMDVLNADGSLVEMCGNGIRAVGLYMQKYHNPSRKKEFHVETLAGLKAVSVSGDEVRVNMEEPKADWKSSKGEEIDINGKIFSFYEVNLGNPHAVIFLGEGTDLTLDQIKALKIARRIETHARFPKRTNVEFVEVLSRKEIKVHVWERGAGWTLACGTGACASAVTCIRRGKTDLNVRVGLPGGTLRVDWAGPGHPVWMQGPAKEVFQGEIEI